MDRESKREKIISDKMREVRLKMRTADQKKDGPEETPSEHEKHISEEKKKVIAMTETNFFKKIEDEERKRRVRLLGGSKLSCLRLKSY